MRYGVAMAALLLGLLSLTTAVLATENVLTYRDHDGTVRSIHVTPAPPEAPKAEAAPETPPLSPEDEEAQKKAEEEKRARLEKERLEAEKRAARRAAEAEAAARAARRAELEEQIRRAQIQANTLPPSAEARRNVLRSQARQMQQELESLR